MPHAIARERPMAEPATMMLTIVLRHDQSRVVGRLQEQLQEQGWTKSFPPAGVEIVSWVVAMGLGQIVTLRFPAERLREVNRSIEDTAWGAFRTEMYATYDFMAIALAQRQTS
jgi:hypothetical protein